MLGAIAAVALLVGGISAAVTVSQDDQQKMGQAQESVVVVQAVEKQDPTFGN